jgi:DNA helicase HerA-like ATPase
LGNRSTVAEQIIKTLIAGKSRNTILFSAQQFKSAVDPVLHENTGIHMIAKLGLSELSTISYSMLDDITKGNIAQMDKGEIVMIQPAIRHPVKVVFPRPPFKRISR